MKVLVDRMTPFKEISLDDDESKPCLITISPEPRSGPMIITASDSNQQQTVLIRVWDQKKNAFSRQSSYLKLVEDEPESNDSVGQQVSYSVSFEKYDGSEFDIFKFR